MEGLDNIIKMSAHAVTIK